MNYEVDRFGRVEVASEGLFEIWFQGLGEHGLAVTVDDEITKFNKQCIEHGKSDFVINPPDPNPSTHFERSREWMIPEEYKAIDVRAYCLELCSDDEERARIDHEMRLYIERDMEDVLRTLIYVIATFRERKIVWGIGRGSSVASLVLYLIGVHKMNPIKFKLEIEDFLR